jgi:hypothetical protein
MGRTGILAVVAALIALALVPAAVTAATPKKGEFVNRSQAKGLYMETTRRTIRTLWLFCRRADYDRDYAHTEFRSARFEIPHPIRIKRGGRFSYRGPGRRFGPEGQPLGNHWKMRLKGRFTSPTRVRITRSLQGCATYTVSARRTRGL